MNGSTVDKVFDYFKRIECIASIQIGGNNEVVYIRGDELQFVDVMPPRIIVLTTNEGSFFPIVDSRMSKHTLEQLFT